MGVTTGQPEANDEVSLIFVEAKQSPCTTTLFEPQLGLLFPAKADRRRV